MKTYLEQLEQLEQLERLPVSCLPKSPFPLESLNSVLSLFTLAIIKSSFVVLCFFVFMPQS